MIAGSTPDPQWLWKERKHKVERLWRSESSPVRILVLFNRSAADPSALYIELLSHRLALTRLRSKTMRLQSELDTVRGIMDELAKGYNPNYQDMAVKGAVVGYEELYKKAEPGVDGK